MELGEVCRCLSRVTELLAHILCYMSLNAYSSVSCLSGLIYLHVSILELRVSVNITLLESIIYG
jgi:hypothetical protein